MKFWFGVEDLVAWMIRVGARDLALEMCGELGWAWKIRIPKAATL